MWCQAGADPTAIVEGNTLRGGNSPLVRLFILVFRASAIGRHLAHLLVDRIVGRSPRDSEE